MAQVGESGGCDVGTEAGSRERCGETLGCAGTHRHVEENDADQQLAQVPLRAGGSVDGVRR